MKFLLPFVLLAFTGCTQATMFVAGDATNAALVDPADAACYNAIGAVAMAKSGLTKDEGILTLTATTQVSQAALASAPCQVVKGHVLDEILKLAPVPGLAALVP